MPALRKTAETLVVVVPLPKRSYPAPGLCRSVASFHRRSLRRNKSQRLGLLPPLKIRIGSGSRIVPLVSLFGKLEEFGVTIAENHVEAVLRLVVVPLAERIGFVAIRPPRPVALD